MEESRGIDCSGNGKSQVNSDLYDTAERRF